MDLPPVRLVSDRKSTRLNSSHSQISYAVFCLKDNNNRASSLFFFKGCGPPRSPPSSPTRPFPDPPPAAVPNRKPASLEGLPRAPEPPVPEDLNETLLPLLSSPNV